jgi:hypothetical protein
MLYTVEIVSILLVALAMVPAETDSAGGHVRGATCLWDVYPVGEQVMAPKHHSWQFWQCLFRRRVGNTSPSSGRSWMEKDAGSLGVFSHRKRGNGIPQLSIIGCGRGNPGLEENRYALYRGANILEGEVIHDQICIRS